MEHRIEKNAGNRTLDQVRPATESRDRTADPQALLTAAKQILGGGDLPSVLETILDNALRLSAADDAGVWLYQENEPNLRLELARGSSIDPPRPGILVNHGVVWDAFQTGKAINVSDSRSSSPVVAWNVDRVGGRSVVAVPLRFRDQKLGVLVVWSFN